MMTFYLLQVTNHGFIYQVFRFLVIHFKYIDMIAESP